ncbi:hypothetical protein HanIR_Chr01g0049271 [Helianthus annuus]|nr:hypothetical protein HanIR_Chr01g0049271 [Helianthus annuus]
MVQCNKATPCVKMAEPPDNIKIARQGCTNIPIDPYSQSPIELKSTIPHCTLQEKKTNTHNPTMSTSKTKVGPKLTMQNE